MADIKWPDGLRGPLVSNYSREEVVGFIESELTAGPAFITPLTDDNPSFHNVTYQLKQGDARRFQQWLRVNKIKTRSPWFDGPLITEDASVEYQECRFTAGGYPQLKSKSVGGIWTYSATLLTREIVTNDEGYETELDSLWGAGNGDIDLSASLLDEGLLYSDE